MGDALAGLPVGQIGAGGLVALIVLLVLAGRLVPRQQLLDARADRDKYADANADLMKAVLQYGMTLEKLLSYAETSQVILHTLQNLAEASAEREDPP